MPVVRVFLCTYRRNALLRRALASLLAQTFTDWVCELHNDDPADPFPARLVAEVGDPRVTVVTHPQNLGPTRTFNLIYRESGERYLSLLEDDNWWEPRFLEVMVREMDRRPDVQLGWANMRFWEEQPDGTWTDGGRCVWSDEVGPDPVAFEWPDRRQVRGAVHSNGAMLARSAGAGALVVPDETPFASVEGVRERLVRYPLLLVPDPLANFAVTRTTARGGDRVQWGRINVLLTASFLRHVRLAPAECRQVWAAARAATPPATGPLVAAGLIDREARYALRYATWRDWARFAAGFVRRPATSLRTLRAKSALPAVWAALDNGTRDTHARAGRPTRFAGPRPAARAE